ncbi:AraC family transcriptional regulator [Bacillus sp. JCM 19041]|uniref:AraC family transcriptional regulator n=1 Tax=Bacillus sp. JCM 19041 TaxID=1460637 RepID=UPI000A9470BD
MYVSQLTPALMDGALRLARLLDTPEDIAVLAPLIQKEILYRLLQEPFGNTLAQVALSGSSTYRISHVIQHILINYQNPIRIEELADIAKMSVATLHRHFKEVTAMSPIQFQKQLRLQEARRLLLINEDDALDVAFQVGYESPSHFSREYSRMFGLPPIEDVSRMRKQLSNQ